MLFRKILRHFIRRVVHNKQGFIATTIAVVGGTTAAIIAGAATTAAIAGGTAAVISSSQARSAAEAQAEAQRQATGVARAESAEEREFQRELAGPEQEFQQAQLDLFRDVFDPGIRDLEPQIRAGLEQPQSLPREILDELFQRGRERIGREFEGLTEKTTQRLAGGGPGKLRGGAAQQIFADIEQERVQSIEDLAIDQAIFEFEDRRFAQQQALENAFRFLGGAPSVGTPSVPSISSPAPFVAPQLPLQSTGIGEAAQTGLRLASLFGTPEISGTGTGTSGIRTDPNQFNFSSPTSLNPF